VINVVSGCVAYTLQDKKLSLYVTNFDCIQAIYAYTELTLINISELLIYQMRQQRYLIFDLLENMH